MLCLYYDEQLMRLIMNPPDYLDNDTMDLLLFIENDQDSYNLLRDIQIELLIYRSQGTYSRVLAKHLFTDVVIRGFNNYNKQIGKLSLNRTQTNELALFLIYEFEGAYVPDYLSQEDFRLFPMSYSVEIH